MTISLTDLPRQVVKTLFQLEPDLIPTFLYRLGSSKLHELSLEIIYEDLTVVDSNSQFRNSTLDGSKNNFSQLSSLIRRPDRYGPLVKSLEICNNLNSSSFVSGSDSAEDVSNNSNQSSVSDSGEWDSSLIGLIGNLINLRSFSWRSDRLPPSSICQSLGLNCQALEIFNLDLVPSSCPKSTRNSLSNSNGHNRSDESDELENEFPSKPLRWDPDSIESLPSTLNQLSVSSLSPNGAKSLSAALEALTWPSLTRIQISRTLFFDDDLISSIVLGSKKLKSLTVGAMAGTKFTDRGILELLNGLDGLEEIELIDVDGRFSKGVWSKLDDLPDSLRAIRLKYQENGLYHSWTLDHLEHIFSLLSLYPHQLECLSVQRCVPSPAMLPGRHDLYPDLAVSSRTSPKKIMKDQVLKIVEEGQSLKELAIDWWLISIEGLEVIVRGLPNLTNLRVMVDAPFHRIISSTAFIHSKIKTLVVSIPPEHTPFLREIGMASPNDKSSTNCPLNSEVISPSSQSQCTSSSNNSSLSSPIPTRDLKKFIKRAGQLKEIQWTGRGGIGRWLFFRNCGSAVNVKVKFIPISDELGREVYQEIEKQESEVRRMRYRSGSCLSSSNSNKNRSSYGQNTKRRRSSVTTNGDRSGGEDCESSRRSSMGSSSLDTSWSSSNHHLGSSSSSSGFCPSVNSNSNNRGHYYRHHYHPHHHQHGGVIGLEGIPGTPHNEGEVNETKTAGDGSKVLEGLNHHHHHHQPSGDNGTMDKHWIGTLEKRFDQIRIHGNY